MVREPDNSPSSLGSGKRGVLLRLGCGLFFQAKIRDFNAVKLWAPYYEKILYEDMLEGDGLKIWLKSLETL